MQGVTTVTSFPSSLSPLIRLVNLILIPLIWLKGLGSTNIAILVRSSGKATGTALAQVAHLALRDLLY